MPITARQRRILERLHDVLRRVTKVGTIGYFLDGEDVKCTIYSLIVRGLVTEDAGGKLRRATPSRTLRPPAPVQARRVARQRSAWEAIIDRSLHRAAQEPSGLTKPVPRSRAPAAPTERDGATMADPDPGSLKRSR